MYYNVGRSVQLVEAGLWWLVQSSEGGAGWPKSHVTFSLSCDSQGETLVTYKSIIPQSNFEEKNRSFLREFISIRELWTHLFREQMNQFPVRVRNVESDRDQRFVTAGRVCVRVQRVSGRTTTRKWELSTPLNALGCAEPSVSFTFVPPPSHPLTHETRRRCTFLPRHYHNFRQLPPT